LGIPTIYEAHDLKQEALRMEMEEKGQHVDWTKLSRITRMENTVLKFADAVVSVSEGTLDSIQSLTPDGIHCLIRNGVRLPRPEELRLGGVPGGPVAYSGHLYGWKGVDLMVQALAAVPKVPFFILGGDEDPGTLGALREQMTLMGLHDRGELRGFVPPREVRSHLMQARVLVLSLPDTYYNRRFTCPLKLLEYMSTGIPIVASDLPTVSQLVRHNKDALLVPPGDVHALSEGIRRLLSDADLSRRLGTSAVERVAQYSWDRRAEMILNLAERIYGTPE